MVKESIRIEEVVSLLNDLLAMDPHTISAIVSLRLSCNEHIANHLTVQVGRLGGSHFVVGVLGILNGLFGVDKYGWGHISADYVGNMVKEFRLLSEKEVGEIVNITQPHDH